MARVCEYTHLHNYENAIPIEAKYLGKGSGDIWHALCEDCRNYFWNNDDNDSLFMFVPIDYFCSLLKR